MSKRKDNLAAPPMYPNEPVRFHRKSVEGFFVWATDLGASDVTIQTGDQIAVEIHGRIHRVTKHFLDHSEIQEILVAMYGSESAKATLSGNSDLDFAYQINPERGRRYRFRVNAVGITVNGSPGIEITARTIPGTPPLLASLNIEPDILRNIRPKQGMIVVAGATGSGKSTLLASIIRDVLEDPEGNRKVITFEAPIEFVYDEVKKPSSLIAQTEIGKSLPSFAAGTRNALRRAPKIVLLGEARDAETIGEAVTVSMTGHLLYTTVHASGFTDIIRRMVNVFNEDKNARATDIVSSLKMAIAQRLVPATDGGRVALREYVIMNDEIVDFILDTGLENLTASCRKVLAQHGRSFLQDATEKYQAGLISQKTWKEIARDAKAVDRDVAEVVSTAKDKADLLNAPVLSADLGHLEWPSSEPSLNIPPNKSPDLPD